MVITQNDVGNDIKMITDSLSDNSRPLVSPVSALKMAMLWPGLCFLGYLAAIIWIVSTYTPGYDSYGDSISIFREFGLGFAFSGGTLVLALILGAGLYAPAVFYLSIPESVRNSSVVIVSLKKTAYRVGGCFISLNLLLAVAACFYRELMVASPFMLMFSFVIMQGILSAEMTRYGIAPLMKKMASLARKI